MKKRTFTANARKTLLRRGRTLLRRSGASGGDLLGGLGDGERLELAEIHNALDRIERGIYGKCVVCDGDIDEQRLVEAPQRARCAECNGDLREAPRSALTHH